MATLAQIEKFLKQRKLPYKTIDLGKDVYAVEGVKKAEINPKEIVKTLVIRIDGSPSTHSINSPQLISGQAGQASSGHSTLRDEPSGSDSKRSTSFAALALRGNDRVDFKKIRAKFGSKSELARADEVLKVAGVPIGAVCPILLNIPVYFDEKVMVLENVHMGSGDLKKGLEMKLSDLLTSLDDFSVLDVSSSLQG